MKKIHSIEEFTRENETEFWSKPIRVSAFGGRECKFVLEEYETDSCQHEFISAINNLLSADHSILTDVQGELYRYYQDINAHFEPGDDWYTDIKSEDKVLNYIHLGDTLYVSRRFYGDKAIYISYSCGCDWEEEHGLQLVFKEGKYVNKLGGFDGHLTNSDAYADESLEDTIYR